MGLDMYLSARNDVGYDDEIRAEKIAELFPEIKAEVKQIVVEAIYWRKANAIHNWFVNNVQFGNDDCRAYYVEKDKLQLLANLIEEVLNNKDKAVDLLPPTPGFFFGSTELDEWYWQSLKYTLEQLKEVLSWPSEWKFSYHSSW